MNAKRKYDLLLCVFGMDKMVYKLDKLLKFPVGYDGKFEYQN